MSVSTLLPEDRETPTLDQLAPGESTYTTPWAMWVDLDRKGWLHPGYKAHPVPGGTVQMKVTRTKDRYTVDLTQCKGYDWKPTSDPCYAGPHGEWIPVAEMIW